MLMVIIGIAGRMGNKLYNFYQDSFEIIGIDKKQVPSVKTYDNLIDIKEKVDVIVDFSSPNSYEMLEYAIQNKIPVLSGTTGYAVDQIQSLQELAAKEETIFYWSANYAKGINLFIKLIEDIYGKYEMLDFIEIHATTKKDSPSGTAKMIAKVLNIEEEKIQSLRINNAPAIHEMIFSSLNERVVIRHEVINSNAFIEGFDEKLNELLR